jgi:exodeoxyribonuclease V alpha subunit
MTRNIDPHQVFADYFENKPAKVLAYAVSQKLSEGNICLDIDAYNRLIASKTVDELKELNPFAETGMQFDLEDLESDSQISTPQGECQPLMMNGSKIYLQRYFQYETEILEQIAAFVKEEECSLDEKRALLISQKEFIKKLFDGNTYPEGLSLAERVNWPLVASLSAIQKNISIITGGPGTGKTTTVAKLLAILFRGSCDLKVALAAPTGKAAARMKESLSQAKDYLPDLSDEIKERFEGMEAKTIHRLLGYVHNSPYFRYNKTNPLLYDVIIVDESSMISASLMSKLLMAVSPSSRIILLGDKNQLASVEAGSILGDICLSLGDEMNTFKPESAAFINDFMPDEASQIPADFIRAEPSTNVLSEHIVELKRSHRFKGNEGIGLFSKALIQGSVSEQDYHDSANCQGEYVKVDETEQSQQMYDFMLRYQSYIEEEDIIQALQKINDIRFLCAVHEGRYGVKHYNRLIERFLKEKNLLTPSTSYYENQPIIITSNDYALGLFNGDVGIIRKDEEGIYKAWFENIDGTLKQVLPGFISSYETVFAMTIHKSQGSEFKAVAVILPKDENLASLTRELLYTGITRGKKEVIVFGKKAVIDACAERKVERASGLTERI